MKHVYSVIRYVPDPFRGEFVNVGAIVRSESAEWAVQRVSNPVRARRFDERGSLPAVWAFIDQVSREVEQSAPSEDWLSDLYERCTNIVQLSAPLPMMAASVDEAMATIFTELIVDPARRRPVRTKQGALDAVREAYATAGILGSVLHGGVLETAGRHHERLDFAVANGRVLQITQAWSFRVADAYLLRNVRAWGWAVERAKADGGELHVGGESFAMSTNLDIEAVYIPPLRGASQSAFLDASAVFSAIGARAVPASEAAGVGTRATRLLDLATH